MHENASRTETWVNPYRFIIGKRIGRVVCFGSVEELKIGSITRRSVAGGGSAHTMQILSKRHPKHRIKKDSKLVISWPHAKKSKILRVS